MNEPITNCDTSVTYFATVEDHFRAARGTTFFMFSTLDWALLEAWKNAGIPVEAVLRGIDVAFEKWRRRPGRARTQMVNSLAYCTQAIAAEAQAMANAAPIARADSKPPFTLENVRDFVGGNAAKLREAGDAVSATSLESLNLEILYADLEQLEQKLTVIEEKIIESLRTEATDEVLAEIRRDLDRDLKPYRGKMTADQLTTLEQQFLERRLLKSAGLPRLSLFYL